MNAEPLYLIGAVAGRRIAIDSAPVDSVVDIIALEPVPGAPPGILGLAALRSRVLTVVDCALALGFEVPMRPAGAPLPTIVLELNLYLYGFVLDRIDDVVTADHPMTPAGAPLGGPWSAASAGIIEIGGSALPVLDPGAVLAAMSARAAERVNGLITRGG
jgi:purine-binding chemotaxis protein CheW